MKKLLLSLSVIFAINITAQDCSELFISEYVEGSSQNKAIEIYNPTANPIDLTDYQIDRYSNGSQSVSDFLQLSGTLAAGDVFVITNGDTDQQGQFGFIDIVLYNMANQVAGAYPTPLHMNGNDAIVLSKNGTIIDIFGKVGEDPGVAWTDDASAGFTDANGGTWWTTNKTLIRKSTVKQGVTMNPTAFNATLEWDSLPNLTWTNLGSHICDCSTTSINEKEDVSYIMSPNPANIGTIVTISAKTKIENIELLNILGERVKFLNTNQINTSAFAKGTYIIRIKFSDGRLAENKLIIE